jgi:hypothetical protein
MHVATKLAQQCSSFPAVWYGYKGVAIFQGCYQHHVGLQATEAVVIATACGHARNNIGTVSRICAQHVAMCRGQLLLQQPLLLSETIVCTSVSMSVWWGRKERVGC